MRVTTSGLVALALVSSAACVSPTAPTSPPPAPVCQMVTVPAREDCQLELIGATLVLVCRTVPGDDADGVQVGRGGPEEHLCPNVRMRG